MYGSRISNHYNYIYIYIYYNIHSTQLYYSTFYMQFIVDLNYDRYFTNLLLVKLHKRGPPFTIG